MTSAKARKQKHLEIAGLLNLYPERVQDPLFQKANDFFDPYDLLQVRYEMLRAHLTEGQAIRQICQRFGLSRQTFYTLQEKFLEGGSAALLPQKSGPKGPSKCTPEIVKFVHQKIKKDHPCKPSWLLDEIKKRFGVTFHLRTLEKLVQDLKAKKKSPK